eukprot:787046-Rhodomonas_salina.1
MRLRLSRSTQAGRRSCAILQLEKQHGPGGGHPGATRGLKGPGLTPLGATEGGRAGPNVRLNINWKSGQSLAALVAPGDVALVAGVLLEAGEGDEQELDLDDVVLDPEALGLLSDHSQIERHVAVPRGAPGVVRGAEAVFDAIDTHGRVRADALQRVAEVRDGLKDDALPHDVDEEADVGRVGSDSLLDRALHALHAAPLDAPPQLVVFLRLRPLEERRRRARGPRRRVRVRGEHGEKPLFRPRLHLLAQDPVHGNGLGVELVEAADRAVQVAGPRDAHAQVAEAARGAATAPRPTGIRHAEEVAGRAVVVLRLDAVEGVFEAGQRANGAVLREQLGPRAVVGFLVGEDGGARAVQDVAAEVVEEHGDAHHDRARRESVDEVRVPEARNLLDHDRHHDHVVDPVHEERLDEPVFEPDQRRRDDQVADRFRPPDRGHRVLLAEHEACRDGDAEDEEAEEVGDEHPLRHTCEAHTREQRREREEGSVEEIADRPVHVHLPRRSQREEHALSSLLWHRRARVE